MPRTVPKTPLGFARAPRTDQHFDIQTEGWNPFWPGRDHHLANEHTTALTQRIAAITQDPSRTFIVPVVEDVLKNAEIRVPGHAVEETSAFVVNSLYHALVCQAFPCALDDVREVEGRYSRVGDCPSN